MSHLQEYAERMHQHQHPAPAPICTCIPAMGRDGSIDHGADCPVPSTPAAPAVDWQARAIEAERQLHETLLKRGYQRSTDDVLFSLAQIAEEQLAVLKHLDARAAAGESRSSAAVKTSTRGVDLEVKSYDDGLLQAAVDDAIEGYRRGQLKLAALQANQWLETVDSLQAAGASSGAGA